MEPVDISAPSLDAVESRLTGALVLVPTAALVFGTIMWLATVIVGMGISESKGIALSWIAIFPTVFGLVAGKQRTARLKRGERGVGAPLLVGMGAGLLASLSLWVFFQAIWPGL